MEGQLACEKERGIRFASVTGSSSDSPGEGVGVGGDRKIALLYEKCVGYLSLRHSQRTSLLLHLCSNQALHFTSTQM